MLIVSEALRLHTFTLYGSFKQVSPFSGHFVYAQRLSAEFRYFYTAAVGVFLICRLRQSPPNPGMLFQRRKKQQQQQKL